MNRVRFSHLQCLQAVCVAGTTCLARAKPFTKASRKMQTTNRQNRYIKWDVNSVNQLSTCFDFSHSQKRPKVFGTYDKLMPKKNTEEP